MKKQCEQLAKEIEKVQNSKISEAESTSRDSKWNLNLKLKETESEITKIDEIQLPPTESLKNYHECLLVCNECLQGYEETSFAPQFSTEPYFYVQSEPILEHIKNFCSFDPRPSPSDPKLKGTENDFQYNKLFFPIPGKNKLLSFSFATGKIL